MAPGTGVASAFIGGDGRPLLEPGALFVDGNYALRLNAWCSVAGVTLALRSRFLRSQDGELVDSGDQLKPTSDRLLTTFDAQLGAGFPLNVNVFALAGTPLIGQCFVQVQIVRGTGVAATVLATVLQGYVSATQALSWPGSPLQNSLDGQGALRSIFTAAGALGQEVGVNVPVNARFQIMAFRGKFVTDATVAARNPSLAFADAFSGYVNSPMNSAQPAGTTFFYTWMTGFGYLVASLGTNFQASLPVGMLLPAGHSVATGTSGIQITDQWFNVDLVVRDWIDV